jgi:hypothetical protein
MKKIGLMILALMATEILPKKPACLLAALLSIQQNLLATAVTR